MADGHNDPVVDAGAATAWRRPEDTPTLATTGVLPLQFVPGFVIANRYRIVSKLGKGGMGEVYRADDLKLGQPVALKFLASEARDARRQQQLIDEVRVGREVAHPNVCRLYDLGEVDGHLFISMEYIDGEDLASLLRRIGRLPADKALALAREICSGLAAAHDRGIVHRDLKPGNIMIDGRGRARITDFGLARAAGHHDAGQVSGTPAYMAPEQFDGAPATIAADIYAAGLILFEIWCGRRLFSGTSVREILEQRGGRQIEQVRSTPEIDRSVATVIEKCLARDPAARPPSAIAVLNALPGGDALDAAVAAGETPSPAMVAAANEKGDLPRAVAWCCLLFVLAGFIAIAALTQRITLRGVISMPLSPAQLETRAREMISIIGWSDLVSVDDESWFETDRDFLRWRERNDDRSSLGQAIRFHYRQSPRWMVATVENTHRINDDDPPFKEPGMVRMEMTPTGQLRSFEVIPRRTTEQLSPPRWPQILALAGLNTHALNPAIPREIAPVDNDVKIAWTGTDPGDGTPIRVEAASLRGRPVWLSIVHPWSGAGRSVSSPVSDALASAAATSLLIGVPIGAFLLARRNLRRGQGDRGGAARLALFVLVVFVANAMLRAHHVPVVGEEGGMVVTALGVALFIATSTWFLYVAVEPFARRRWPKILISWSRLLEGRVLDPMIGRDLLVGLVGGIFVTGIISLTSIAPRWLGLDDPIPLPTVMASFSNLPEFAAALIGTIAISVLRVIAAIAIFVFLRGLLRNQAATVIVALLFIGTAVLDYATGPFAVRAVAVLLTAPIALILLFRFGLLALCAEAWVVEVARRLPLTVDPSSWYFGRSFFALAIVAALALIAFWQSLGEKPLFPGPVFED